MVDMLVDADSQDLKALAEDEPHWASLLMQADRLLACSLVGDVAINAAAPSGARSVKASSKIEAVIPMLLDRDEPIAVVNDDGSPLGIVDRSSIAAILSAEQR
ncbi:MAG: hypothetical protein EBY93_05770 [Actinobacteria bacterium]|nr:hypothetical protein [Actinomycetota bacterium]